MNLRIEKQDGTCLGGGSFFLMNPLVSSTLENARLFVLLLPAPNQRNYVYSAVEMYVKAPSCKRRRIGRGISKNHSIRDNGYFAHLLHANLLFSKKELMWL